MPRHKKALSITLSEDLLEWIESEIESARFGSVSHACEYALRTLKNSEAKELKLLEKENPYLKEAYKATK